MLPIEAYALAKKHTDNIVYGKNLKNEHIIRETPNGAKDELYLGSDGQYRKIQNISDEYIIDGSLGWRLSASGEYANHYRMFVPNWVIGKNAVVNTDLSGVAFNAEYDFPVRATSQGIDERGIVLGSSGPLYLTVDKTRIDEMSGSTIVDRFKAYLNKYPISFYFQLAEPVEIKYPADLTPLSKEVVRLSASIDYFHKYLRSHYIFRDLPNGVADAYVKHGDGYRIIKRVSDEIVIDNSFVWELETQRPSVDCVLIRNVITENYNKGVYDNNFARISLGWEQRMSNQTTTGYDLPGDEFKFAVTSTGNLRLIFPKGHYADLEEAQRDLEGLTLIYELAEPSIIDLPEEVSPNTMEIQRIKEELRAIKNQQPADALYLKGDFNKIYETKPVDDMSVGQPFDLKASEYTDLYAKYDELLAEHPGLITRNLLGYAGDENDNPDENIPIYELCVHTPETTNDMIVNADLYKAPTILIIGGTHGNEKASTMALYLFIKDLLENFETDPILGDIKSSVNFKIIPCINPTGYNRNSRLTASGTDISRNSAYGWEESSHSAKGTAPFSAPESAILRDWIIENRDAFFIINWHNMSRNIADRPPETASYLITPNPEMTKWYSPLLRRMSIKWSKQYFSNFSDLGHIAYGYDMSANYRTTPTMMNWAYHNLGIKNVCTPEITYSDPVTPEKSYTKAVMETNVEWLGNLILTILDYYNKK